MAQCNETNQPSCWGGRWTVNSLIHILKFSSVWLITEKTHIIMKWQSKFFQPASFFQGVALHFGDAIFQHIFFFVKLINVKFCYWFFVSASWQTYQSAGNLSSAPTLAKKKKMHAIEMQWIVFPTIADFFFHPHPLILIPWFFLRSAEAHS